jgi:hypothetical protein
MSPRIFISYAHRDGAGLPHDLQAFNFDVWLHRLRLRAGDTWAKEVETALGRARVVLALRSDGSFTSAT